MEPVPPSPLPVEGDVQVFLDPECTQYATGIVSTVYVRINVPWIGSGSGWTSGSSLVGVFMAFSPDDEYGSDSYSFSVYTDIVSTVNGPYSVGQVVPGSVGVGDPIDISGYTTVFSKP